MLCMYSMNLRNGQSIAGVRTEIRYFLEVATTGNFTKAAVKLRIGQSALSKAIERLESDLGVRLLDRGRKGARLTGQGQIFWRRVREWVDNWESIASEFSGSPPNLRVNLRMGCHPMIARTLLPDVLCRFETNPPGFRLSVVTTGSLSVSESVREGDLDFGIVIKPAAFPDVLCIHIMDVHTSFWTGHTTTNGRQANESSDLFVCPEMPELGDLLDRLPLKGKEYSQIVHVSDYDTIALTIAMSKGVGVLPDHVAAMMVPKALKRVHPKAAVRSGLYLIYRRNLVQQKYLKVFQTALEESVRSLDWA